MRPPPGFKGSDKNKVCLLKKSLYGLKQPPRCWFEKLSSSLLTYGFTQSLSDHSLFNMDRGTYYIMVLIYVDDLVVLASKSSLLASFKAYMHRCFHMKDLGVSKYFLGLELACGPLGIYLCQMLLPLSKKLVSWLLNLQLFQLNRTGLWPSTKALILLTSLPIDALLDALSILPSRVQTWRTRFTSLLNSCRSQNLLIGMLRYELYVI